MPIELNEKLQTLYISTFKDENWNLVNKPTIEDEVRKHCARLSLTAWDIIATRLNQMRGNEHRFLTILAWAHHPFLPLLSLPASPKEKEFLEVSATLLAFMFGYLKKINPFSVHRWLCAIPL